MHNSSLLRMKWFKDTYLHTNKRYKVLDIGSYGLNGTYREIFNEKNFSYFGLDIQKGPNVDIVPENIYDWKEIEDDEFDVIISGQAFEHIEFFWVTMEEIARVLKKNGLVCIIAPHGFGEHRCPVDCWRFFSDGMVALARWTNLTVLHAHTNSGPSFRHHRWFSKNAADSLLVAKKEYTGKMNFDKTSYFCVPLNEHEKQQDFINQKKYYSKPISKIVTFLRSTLLVLYPLLEFIKKK